MHQLAVKRRLTKSAITCTHKLCDYLYVGYISLCLSVTPTKTSLQVCEILHAGARQHRMQTGLGSYPKNLCSVGS